MATVKGQNLRVFIGEKPIASALSCELNVQANVKEYSTKDDTNSFANHHVVSLLWSINASGVVSNDAGRNDAPSLLDRMGETVNVELALASGEKNSEKNDVLLNGDAVISDIQVTAENRKRGTFDMVLTGKKNMLFPLRLLCSSNSHLLITSDGHCLTVWHEET